MTRSHERNISNHSLISPKDSIRVLDAETAVDMLPNVQNSGPIMFVHEQPNHCETRRLASLSSFVGASPLSNKASKASFITFKEGDSSDR